MAAVLTDSLLDWMIQRQDVELPHAALGDGVHPRNHQPTGFFLEHVFDRSFRAITVPLHDAA